MIQTTTDFVPAREITEQELENYRTEGYVVLPNLISQEQAEELRREVMSIMEGIGFGMTKLQQTHQYLRGSKLDEFIHSENMRAIASALMEGNATLYLPFTAVKSANGGGRFHFHQDNQYTKFDGPGINLWTALTPMTKENGCLQVIPRSHLQGTLESELSGDGDQHKKIRWEPKDFVSIEMHPGDCVAFTRLTVHGSGANTTNEHRVAYANQYHRHDVKAFFNDAWRLLKDEPRWTDIGPVDRITAPTEARRDGH
jgi:2-oxoglutarate-dependent dioxygenase